MEAHRLLDEARKQPTDQAARQPDDTIVDVRKVVARANALREAGLLSEAAASYRNALALEPAHMEALVNLGATWRMLQQPQQAIAPLLKALALQPGEPAASVGLAMAMAEMGKAEAGLEALEKSMHASPGRLELLLARADLLHRLGDLAQADACLSTALVKHPASAQALCNRGFVRAELHRPEEALVDLNAALALRPEFAQAWLNRGMVRRMLKDLPGAIADFDRAIALDDRLYVAHSNRGTVLDELGQADAAIASLQRAVELKPDFGEARWNLAVALLGCGRLEEGWSHFEARWKRKRLDTQPLHTDRPRWHPGQDDERVLVWAEQGIGDQILALSLVGEFARTVPRLTVSVDARLMPLLRRSIPGVAFVDRKNPPPEEAYDSHLPMGSLARYLRPGLVDFSRAPRRFLEPDAARRAGYRSLGRGPDRLKCGLSWRSNRAAIGADKSLSLVQLLPLMQLPGIDFIDLQYGDTGPERARLAVLHQVEVLEHPDLDKTLDLDGLAAAVDACDVVVTSSNTTAHVAGALGKPTLLLLPRGSGRLWYWRLSQGGRSLWYPKVLIVEQAEPGRWEEAVEAARVQLARWRAEAWLKRASEWLQQGHDAQAEALLERSVALCPDEPGYRFAWANCLRKRGATALALQAFDDVIEQAPHLAEAHNNRANLLLDLNRWQEALSGYDRAVQAQPRYAAALVNKGVVLNRVGRFLEALASFEQALQVEPTRVDALISRGTTLDTLGRTADGLQSLDEAVRVEPASQHAWVERGRLLNKSGRLVEAASSYERALELGGSRSFLFGHYLHLCMKLCAWDRLPELLHTARVHIERGERQVPPFVAVGTLDDPALHRRAAEIFSQAKFPADLALGPIVPRAPGPRLRVGYFSPDFRQHAVGLLTAGLFEHHDRERFEITCFWWGPESGGEIRQRIADGCDHMVDIRALSNREVAALARRLELDIAIDLTGHTEYTRTDIFALRAAPVQASYIGYLGTMGAAYFDYLIADRHIVPDALREHYTEKIVRLPHYQANDARRHRPDQPRRRADLGIPEDAVVLGCVNNTYKITPEVFDTWMRVLRRVSGAVLYLYVEEEAAASRLRARASALGVDPIRLHLAGRLPYGEYLSRFGALDLFLDTMPYNAGTTASDALWVGLPVLTCTGQSFAARMGGSILHALGLEELVTSGLQEYEEAAVRLASDPNLLAQVRRKVVELRDTCALFDTRRFTRSFEDALSAMGERLHRGLPPEHIDVVG